MLFICETRKNALSDAACQGQAGRCGVLAGKCSGLRFIWLSHVIWDIVEGDSSLKQHTPPCTVSLLSHSGLHYHLHICEASCWINI